MSVDYRVVVNHGWRGWLRNEVTRYLHKLGREIQNDAERLAPVKTGRLRASMYHEVNRGELRVGVRHVDYWMTVEYGSGPHIITPKNAKALYWPGARHPVAKVNHPGTPAQPFLRPALYRRRGGR
ncbi:HK97 gp10 family phage protein [Streptomyces malaysiensis]|uniref:HK97 gp10 family phage protein n=1 Tax=Streptomyces malaysiensis subsp. samsunensis TaxID=459658 RepID=A0A9X2LYV5_STRMQ|nr:HK97 gp10 family phage protein [Streptomyces samsunensis]MCQ8831760.1 HK97 gp10 family phage protein [Streptomyces samsunensis]